MTDSKEIAIDAAYVGGGADPWGGNRVGFTGTTRIALADYGINFNLGPASKEVELTLDVEGTKRTVLLAEVTKAVVQVEFSRGEADA